MEVLLCSLSSTSVMPPQCENWVLGGRLMQRLVSLLDVRELCTEPSPLCRMLLSNIYLSVDCSLCVSTPKAFGGALVLLTLLSASQLPALLTPKCETKAQENHLFH